MARMETTPSRPSQPSQNVPTRKRLCWDPKFMLLALLAAGVIIAAALVSTAFPRGSWQRIALAVVEAVATTGAVLMPVRTLRRLDEMQQRIQLEALAFAFFGTGILGISYGFLESAGMPRLDWGAVLWPAMVGLWALGTFLSSRRYR
jgi:hypothetical protein